MASPPLQTIVEHVVLFKAKQGASQEALEVCIRRFRALCELEGVIYLQAGPIRACEPQEGAWTHVLYGRYQDKAALEAYAKHPAHVSAVAMADPLFQDKMALDWEASVEKTHIGKPSFAAAHIVFVQWVHPPHRPKAADEIGHALSQALFSSSPSTSSSSSPPLPSPSSSSLHLYSSGANFSPGRARGFHWGFAAFFCSRPVPPLHHLVQALAHDPSVQRFLCIDFATEDEMLARL